MSSGYVAVWISMGVDLADSRAGSTSPMLDTNENKSIAYFR